VAGATAGDAFTVLGTTTATQFSDVGSYAIVPTASGPDLNDYTVTAIDGMLMVTQAASSLSLASSNANANLYASVTLTAIVSSTTTGTPAGTVTFVDGTTDLGSATLNSQGIASYTTSSLAAGAHIITANYSGDTDFASSTSADVLETVTAADFTLTVNPTALTIVQGQSGVATFTVTPVGGFNQPIQFTCASLPANATCTFNPTTVTPNGAPISSTLTITTTAPSSSFVTPQSSSSLGLVLYLGDFGLGGCMLFLSLGCRRKRMLRSKLFSAILLALLLSADASLVGCIRPASKGTPIGTDTVTVDASTSISGGTSHSVSLTVTITN